MLGVCISFLAIIISEGVLVYSTIGIVLKEYKGIDLPLIDKIYWVD